MIKVNAYATKVNGAYSARTLWQAIKAITESKDISRYASLSVACRLFNTTVDIRVIKASNSVYWVRTSKSQITIYHDSISTYYLCGSYIQY